MEKIRNAYQIGDLLVDLDKVEAVGPIIIALTREEESYFTLLPSDIRITLSYEETKPISAIYIHQYEKLQAQYKDELDKIKSDYSKKRINAFTLYHVFEQRATPASYKKKMSMNREQRNDGLLDALQSLREKFIVKWLTTGTDYPEVPIYEN